MDNTSENYSAADIVFTGYPIAVEASPGAWSGTLAISQVVRYRVVHVYKGSLDHAQAVVRVEHLLVQGAPTADEHTARLRATLFDPAKLLLVFATKSDKLLSCLNPSDGVVLASEQVVSSLPLPR